MFDWAVFIALGIIVGFTGGYAGIGGAPFLVAGLVLFLGFDQHLAQGTVLAVMLGPMSLPGVMVMWDRVRLMFAEIGIGVVCYAIISNLGARMAYAIEGDTLSFAFGCLLFLLGLRYLFRRQGTGEIDLDPTRITVGEGGLIPFNTATVIGISSLVGFVGGLFGIGAGVLMVPLFISLCDLHKDDARSLSLAILLPPVSIGAVLEYQSHDGIRWSAAAAIFVLYFITNSTGAKVGRAHDSRRFLIGMGWILLSLGILTCCMSLGLFSRW